MNLNETLDHIGNVAVYLALIGVAPNSHAAMEQVAHAGGRLVHLTVSSQGLYGCVLTRGQQVVHAEVRSAELHVIPDRPGRLVWRGEAALYALAILLGTRPVEVAIVATAEPVCGHATNLDVPLSLALLKMAMATDERMPISGLPCTLEA